MKKIRKIRILDLCIKPVEILASFYTKIIKRLVGS